jgi:AraC family transcriptional regulator
MDGIWRFGTSRHVFVSRNSRKKEVVMIVRVAIIIGIIAPLAVSWAAEPEIVELANMTVVGMQSLVSMKHNLIHELWVRFMESGHKINNMTNEDVYIGISWGYKDIGEGEEKETQFLHLAGAPVTDLNDLPEGFTYKEIPAQKYAKFVHRGPLSKLGETYHHIFAVWLPESKYLYDEGKCDIEWYDERFQEGKEDSEFDIYVPVTEKE